MSAERSGARADLVAGQPLAYVSDYFSFVGRDADGWVSFALDDNRGYDEQLPAGARHQAEHGYAVLHDEVRGWVPLRGVTRYDPHGELLAIPDSDWWTSTGTPAGGLVLTSRPNDLRLAVEPLSDRLVGADGSTLFAMTSGAAVLHWAGRVLSGRVIHEGLASSALNLLSRRSFAGLSGLEFLYLVAGADDDLYLQKALGPTAMAGLPAQTGFHRTGPGSQVVQDLLIRTVGSRPAVGLHRWPVAWEATWSTPQGRWRARLTTLDRRVVGRYVVAGFAMAVVSGTLHPPTGGPLPLRGFAELLALGPVGKALARRGDG